MANRFNIGDLEVYALVDGKATVDDRYMNGVTLEQWQPHKRWLTHDDRLELPFTSFLVRSGDKRVIIDCGLGPIKGGGYEGGAMMDDLATTGVTPAEIDVVFVTHLHADHVGWGATRDGDVLRVTFPNAAYRWTAAEQEFWSGDLPPQQIARRDIFAAVAPHFEPADGGTSLAPGIDVVAMPGHTPGHAGVVLSSGDQRAFLLGDAIACPVQLEEPEWSGVGDMDPALARRTQEAVAKEIEEGNALATASHFPGLTFGRVLRGEGKRYWQPVG
jgi:glyoxylase-like metal-dependent hydrolase (beta-lactamase superfamily II)